MVRDLDTDRPRRVTIDGPAGALVGTYERPSAEPRAVVLHLHPHPLHGGTRQNNVVRHGALGSLEAGCAALRFDFRGAGQSEGVHDEGRGEVNDAVCALEWLRGEHPGLPVFLWGFSFGSRVGLHLGIRERDTIAGYLGVAWPSAIYAWPEEQDWPARMAILSGTEDDFVDFEKYTPMVERNAAITRVEGANHFFHGMLDRVRGFTRDTIEDWLAD